MYKIVISILWLMLICACGIGQDSPRTQGELNLIITDNDNNFVGDITKDEIMYLMDGKEQNIVSLEKQTLPLIYVLAVDSSGSMRTIFKDILNAGKSIVSRNNQNDLTLLMRFIS